MLTEVDSDAKEGSIALKRSRDMEPTKPVSH